MEIMGPWAFEPTVEGIVMHFTEAVNQHVAQWRESVAAEPLRFVEVEAEALRFCADLAGPLCVAVLSSPEVQAALETKAESLRQQAIGGPQKVYRCDRTVRLLSGAKLQMSTCYCVARRPGKGSARTGRRRARAVGFYPEWAALGIREGVSAQLQSEAGRLSAILPSFEMACEELKRRGCALNIKTLRRVALELGQAALCVRREQLELFRAGHMPAGQELHGKRVVVAIDGGRARTRKRHPCGRKTARGRRRYQTPWREPKLAIIYALDERGRMDRSFPPLIEGTLAGPDALMELVAMHLHRLGAAGAAQGIFLADGAEWIWDRIAAVRRQAALPSFPWKEAIDLSHVVSHIAAALASCHTLSETERKRRLSCLKHKLLMGKLDEVLASLSKLRRGRRSKAVRTEMAYLQKRRYRLLYHWLLYHRLPLGSGAIESAVRRVLNLRLKGPGIFWDEKNLEAMLQLRACAVSRRWTPMLDSVRERHRRTRDLTWQWEPTPMSVSKASKPQPSDSKALRAKTG